MVSRELGDLGVFSLFDLEHFHAANEAMCTRNAKERDSVLLMLGLQFLLQFIELLFELNFKFMCPPFEFLSLFAYLLFLFLQTTFSLALNTKCELF